jgi:Ca-activated chloride channel family protein
LDTYNITGINSLYQLIQTHPGVVKMAHTDPTLSNSGFMAVIMELAAALGKDPSQLTMADLENATAQNYLRVLESAAVEYGDSSGFLANMMASGGPSKINVAFLYENLVQENANAYPGQKMVAVYPQEGTLFSDHPFCILNASWVTPDDDFVAEKFIQFIQQPSMINLAMQNGFRPIDPSIPLDPQIFNYTNYGISPTFNSPQMHVPTSGDVLSRVVDVWQLAKSVM